MKRNLTILITTACLLAAGAGNAAAQNGRVSIENITNTISPNVLAAGSTHRITIRYDFTEVPDLGTPWWTSNGFEIYSPNGADWGYLDAITQPLIQEVSQRSGSFAMFQEYFHYDGSVWNNLGFSTEIGPGSSGPDSRTAFKFVTIDVLGQGGFLPGVDNDIVLEFEFVSYISDDEKTICFDTCDAITAWEWSDGTEDYPVWDNGLGTDGPRCMSIGNWVPMPAEWCLNPAEDALLLSYCHDASFQLCAISPNGFPVSYMMAPGFEGGSFGSVDSQTGIWTLDRWTVPPGQYDIQFLAYDPTGEVESPFTLHLTLTSTGCDCCTGRVGDVNDIGGPEPTIGDISAMIDMLFINHNPINCPPKADFNQSGGMYPTIDDITIGDISGLIECIFIIGLDDCVLPDCIPME